MTIKRQRSIGGETVCRQGLCGLVHVDRLYQEGQLLYIGTLLVFFVVYLTKWASWA